MLSVDAEKRSAVMKDVRDRSFALGQAEGFRHASRILREDLDVINDPDLAVLVSATRLVVVESM